MTVRIVAVEGGVERLGERLKTPAGADVFEDGVIQASRAVSDDRSARLANLIAGEFTAADFDHDRLKSLVRLFSQLTDSELILLTFYSKTPTIGSAWHAEMMQRFPEVLRPLSREIGLPEAKRDRLALQDHHKETLVRFGLLKIDIDHASITPLGNLLVRYMLAPERETPVP